VIAVWVTRDGRNATAQLVPLVFLLVMTTWALVLNLIDFVREGDWVLAPLDAIIMVLAGWLIVEAFLGIRDARAGRLGPNRDLTLEDRDATGTDTRER
jgi:carbon starvation protein